jgi:hypothetical protein
MVRFAFVPVACCMTMTAFGAPPMLASVVSLKANHSTHSPPTNDVGPCLASTPKCAEIGTPPKACLAGGADANTCQTDAKVVAVSLKIDN